MPGGTFSFSRDENLYHIFQLKNFRGDGFGVLFLGYFPSRINIVALKNLAVDLPGYFTRESTKPRGVVYPERVQYKRANKWMNSQ